jgi:hypothetical protein
MTIILASCSSGNFFEYKDLAAKYGLPKFVEPGDYPEDDGVVLLSTTEFKMQVYSSSVTTEETVHMMKKLFKNIEKYAFIEIPVYNTEKLEKISARTIKPDGTSVQIKPEEFYESTGKGEGATFYSDKKTIRFTFPSIEKNCIIEYEYSKLKLFPFMTDEWEIHHSLPTLVNQYSLSCPKILVLSKANGGAGWNWNYKAYNYFLDTPTLEDQAVQKSLWDQTQTFRWTLKNVPPLREEVLMPPVDNFLGYVKFAPSEWKKWNDISEWYYKDYFEPQLKVDSDIEVLALKLTSGTDDKIEKIKRLYDYVKDIRYVSISLGNGTIKPSQPANILKRQYGDCKDKSILLIALLKAAGIESKPVLVLTSDIGKLDPGFPSWNFNHMIVKTTGLNKKDLWLDPTAKFTPFGKLPPDDENINVLVLNPDNTSQIELTSEFMSQDNLRDISLELNINDSGTADFSADIKYYGVTNSNIRYRLEDNTDKEMKEYCKSLIADEFTNAQITSYEISDLDSLKSVYNLKFKGKADNILQNQGDLMLVTSDPFRFFEQTSWMVKDKRDYPIYFDYPVGLNKTITINLPKGYSVRNLPNKMYQATGDVSYSKMFSKKDNSIVLDEKYKMTNPLIDSDNFLHTKNFFETVKNRFGEKLILQRN